MPAVGSFYEYARLALQRPAAARRARRLSDRLDVLVLLGHRRRARGGRRRRAGAASGCREAPAWFVSLVAARRADADQPHLGRAVTASSSSGSPRSRSARSSCFCCSAACTCCGLWPRRCTRDVAIPHGARRLRPNGICPMLTGAVAATGFYFGAEIVTIAAAEASRAREGGGQGDELGHHTRAGVLCGLGVAGRVPGALEFAVNRHALRQRARSDGNSRRGAAS